MIEHLKKTRLAIWKRASLESFRFDYP